MNELMNELKSKFAVRGLGQALPNQMFPFQKPRYNKYIYWGTHFKYSNEKFKTSRNKAKIELKRESRA